MYDPMLIPSMRPLSAIKFNLAATEIEPLEADLTRDYTGKASNKTPEEIRRDGELRFVTN